MLPAPWCNIGRHLESLRLYDVALAMYDRPRRCWRIGERRGGLLVENRLGRSTVPAGSAMRRW